MKWYHGLYIGTTARRRRYEIVWKIQRRAGLINVYVITLASNEENLLDIINSAMLLQPHYKKEEVYIVGIACGYDEAVETAARIVEEVYRETGTFRIRDYIVKER